MLGDGASAFGISICHTVFNILCTALLLPSGKLLEKLVCLLVPDAKEPEQVSELDERLFATPSIALERSRGLTAEMAQCAAQVLHQSVACLKGYTPELAESVRELEEKTDHYEDILSTYLVKLSSRNISEADSAEAAMLLKAIGDLERVGDHALNLMEAAEELHQKELSFTDAAQAELAVLISAVEEIVEMSFKAFLENDLELAWQVEPLEQVIDDLKEALRVHHIQRLQQGNCSIETGFVWSDLLTALERTGDHCSNIAGCVVDMAHHDMNTHDALRSARIENQHFAKQYKEYANKYRLA
jgi:phosphate:Na+ symporter